jgi:uncharacterized HAD superfamily protein
LPGGAILAKVFRVERDAAIYVDLDDVLSQTIRGLLVLLERRTGRRLAEDQVTSFDLGRCFGLTGPELEDFMRHAHRPEHLSALEPSPGAAETLGSWVARGHDVHVMTGRPPSTRRESRRWLERHGIPHTALRCVDKYGRADWYEDADPALSFAALRDYGFRLAIEDSLEIAVRLIEECGIPVLLMDRPWNRDLSRLGSRAVAGLVRCRDWSEIAERFPPW